MLAVINWAYSRKWASFRRISIVMHRVILDGDRCLERMLTLGMVGKQTSRLAISTLLWPLKTNILHLWPLEQSQDGREDFDFDWPGVLLETTVHISPPTYWA